MPSLLPPVPPRPGFLPIFAKIKLVFKSGTCTLYPRLAVLLWGTWCGSLSPVIAAWHSSMVLSAASWVPLRDLDSAEAKSFNCAPGKNFRLSQCEAELEVFLRKGFNIGLSMRVNGKRNASFKKGTYHPRVGVSISRASLDILMVASM